MQNTIEFNITDVTARKVLKMAEEFYSDPQNQKAFGEWKAKRKAERNK